MHKQRNGIRRCLTFATNKTEPMVLDRYAALAFALPLALAAGAQSITLVAPGNVPINGSEFLVQRGPYIAPVAGGAGMLFNFNALAGTSTNTYKWQAPASLPNGAQFPSAQFALTNGGPDTVFYKATTDGLERVGDTQTITALATDYHFATSFSNSILELKLPLTYGDPSWTDLFQGSFVIDGNASTRNGGITGTADAWGRVVLPGGADTVEVLRVTTHLTESIPLTVGGFGITVTHIRDINAFYPLWGKFPVLRTVSDSLNSQFLNQAYAYTEWLDASAVGIASLNADLINVRVFPNPASELAEVTFNGTQGAATMEVVDMRGATVLHKLIGRSGNAPAVEHIDVSLWDAGVYQVLLTDAKGSRSTRRFVVAH